MSVCLFVRGLWGGCWTASQPFNHAFTSFGTITIYPETAQEDTRYGRIGALISSFSDLFPIWGNGMVSSGSLRILMLGEFQIHHGDRALTGLLTPRLQSLIAYLLLHRDIAPSRQKLAFQFWPDASDRQARANLRKALHRLRQLFPNLDLFLEMDGATLNWRSDVPMWLDVADFEEKLQMAEMAGMEQQSELLEAALALYKGNLLPDHYDDWVLTYREQTRQRYLDALDLLAELQEAKREYTAASQTVKRLLREDPVSERGYRRLMRLQALGGDVARALHTYHKCAALLEQELGVEPAPATQAVYRQILRLQALPDQPSYIHAPRQFPLIGRNQVWQALLATWRETVAGNSQAVIISGEAGIGKTRLAEELLTWALRQGIPCLSTACFATEDQLPFGPVADLLRSEAAQQTLPALASRWRSEVARVLPELLAIDPELEMPPPMTEPWQKQHLFMALAEAVAAVGAPLLIFVDDLHWADANTLAWLHFLARHKSGIGLLLMATIRSEEMITNHLLIPWQTELARTVSLQHLTLSRLDLDSTAALASHLLGKELDAATAEALYRATEGSPLFTLELARAGLKQSQSALPHEIRSVIELLLSRLSPLARELVGLAAIIGRSFTFPLLAAASKLPKEKVVRGLDELWQRQIVREQGEEAYDFNHDMIRQVALVQLSTARKRWGHRRVAQALESVFAMDLNSVHGQIAVHWEAADHKQKAADHYVQAAASASRLYAHEESVRYLQRALALLPDDSSHRVEIYTTLGESFKALGQIPQAAAAYQKAADATEHSLEKARLLSRSVDALLVPTHLREARSVYEKAQVLLEIIPAAERDATAWRIWIDLHLALLAALYFENESDEMAHILQAMVEPLEAYGTAQQRAYYFASLGRRRNRILRFYLNGEEMAYGRAALDWARQAGDDALITYHQLNLGFDLLLAGRVVEAIAEMQQAASLTDALGNLPLQSQYFTYLSVAYRFQGDAHRVREAVEKLAPLAERANNRTYLGVAEAQQSWLAFREGYNATADAYGRSAIAYWGTLEAVYPMQWLARLPLLAIALERVSEGEVLTEAQEHARAMLLLVQQRLPDPLTEALKAAVAAKTPAVSILNLEQAVCLAQEHGYL
jgi:DNA-binding SARP family transcriptional activator